jgi:hypothetical protein
MRMRGRNLQPLLTLPNEGGEANGQEVSEITEVTDRIEPAE